MIYHNVPGDMFITTPDDSDPWIDLIISAGYFLRVKSFNQIVELVPDGRAAIAGLSWMKVWHGKL